jgi:hypothetical protein
MFVLHYNRSKYRLIIISALLLSVLWNIYIYTVSFKNRYSTNFIGMKYINEQKSINIAKTDRFIVIPSMWDYICINTNTRYCGPNILKWISMWEYYTSPGGAPILIDNLSTEKIIETIKWRWINKIVIQNNYNYQISNKDKKNTYIELIQKLNQKYKTIYKDKTVSVIDLWSRVYLNSLWYISLLDFKVQSKYSYKIALNITGTGNIIFKDTYNKYWELLDQNNKKIKFKNIKTSFYTNSWIISKSDIIGHVKQNYSKELKRWWYPLLLKNWKKDYKYFILNPDWSIYINTTLYFKPQRYFYDWLIISATTLLVLFWYLWYTNIYRNRKHKKTKKTV